MAASCFFFLVVTAMDEVEVVRTGKNDFRRLVNRVACAFAIWTQ